ncbi:hypothetical protein C9374_011212 [Naegleria lovaniensis]|uniref:Uncharacterized protein n=1 Tax=Naegleria lovaniensis TaxID=51637 RepID=A0AA88KDH3_NAELO|nr:uncharacterized protein C9374_011212 [Naegleria lovaniensis]KAG2374133.1 hypothetical protein C9374_011212 [Naegleria lovaniensis]
MKRPSSRSGSFSSTSPASSSGSSNARSSLNGIISVQRIKNTANENPYIDEDEDLKYHNYSERKLKQPIGQTIMELSNSSTMKNTTRKSQNASLNGSSSAIPPSNGPQSESITKSSFKTKEETILEEEYIRNLQKQINLLSTELDLQKKVNQERERKMAEKTDALEDPILTLKKKFAEKDEINHHYIEKFQQEIADRENTIVKLKEKYKKWKNKNVQERESAKQEIRSLHEKYVPEVIKLEKQVDMLQLRLKQEQTENERKNEDAKQFLKEIGEITKQVDFLKMQKDQTEKQLQPLMDELSQVKKELLSYNTDRDKDKNEIESLKGRLSKYEKEWEDAVHQLKKKELETKQLELDKELLCAERDKVKEQVVTLNNKNNELDTQITKLQTKLNETQWI